MLCQMGSPCSSFVCWVLFRFFLFSCFCWVLFMFSLFFFSLLGSLQVFHLPLVVLVSPPCIPRSAGFFSCSPCSPCVNWVLSRFSMLSLCLLCSSCSPFVCWVLLRFFMFSLFPLCPTGISRVLHVLKVFAVLAGYFLCTLCSPACYPVSAGFCPASEFYRCVCWVLEVLLFLLRSLCVLNVSSAFSDVDGENMEI